MARYPRPKSSMSGKPTRSSLHPEGFPTFAETVEGLSRGLAGLGVHLAGAAVGMADNLIGQLLHIKKSAREGDEEADKAYEEALVMLRNSQSSTAEELLRNLGEQLQE